MKSVSSNLTRVLTITNKSIMESILPSLSKVIEFLELDAQQLEETDPWLEEVNKTLKVLNFLC